MYKGSNTTSVPNGKVKGLLVGINYTGTAYALGGCINDVLAVQKLIRSSYPNAELELLSDNTVEKPTRNNILKKLANLVDNAKPGDTLIFDFSGHGSQVQDIHGDEDDGLDETICPIDFRLSRVIYHNNQRLVVDSQILDDEIKAIISNVPHGVRFLMISDSCHSGHIADLDNDFSNYTGPSVWPNETCENLVTQNLKPLSTSSSTEAHAASATNQTPQLHEYLDYVRPNETNTDHNSQVVSTIKTTALWVYVQLSGKEELWIMPYNSNLFTEFANKRYAINVTNEKQNFANLSSQPNVSKTTATEFEILANGDYRVSSPELGINNLVLKNNKNKLILNQINIYNSQFGMSNEQLLGQSQQAAANNIKPNKSNWTDWMLGKLHNKDLPTVISTRDYKTGKYLHINNISGEKRTLSMRSLDNNCKGGELRIISGCREDQTSADTGVNGACTIAFLHTVNVLGGLKNFLEKIFSHNIQDFKLVENTINKYLSNFGFTQHSVFSWDHSHAARELEESMGLALDNEAGLSVANATVPIIYRNAVPRDKIQDYLDNAISLIKADSNRFKQDEKSELKISDYRRARNII